MKEGVLKVAFEPVPETKAHAGPTVGNHGLSPLADRTLKEVIEAGIVRCRQTKVVTCDSALCGPEGPQRVF